MHRPLASLPSLALACTWLLYSLTLANLPTTTLAAEFSTNATACTRFYRVQPEDTCDIIGQKTITSTYQVLAFNLPAAGPDCYTLQNGADICLGRYGSDCQLVHRATSTDTCYSIGEQYGISIELLRDNNPTLDCGQVYDGLNLCVAPGVVRPEPVGDLATLVEAHRATTRRRRRDLGASDPTV